MASVWGAQASKGHSRKASRRYLAYKGIAEFCLNSTWKKQADRCKNGLPVRGKVGTEQSQAVCLLLLVDVSFMDAWKKAQP